MPSYLKETFPEIARAIPLSQETFPDSKISIEGTEHTVDLLQIDSSFFSFFDVRIVEGSRDFLIYNSKNVAITRAKSRQLFGDENPIGKTVKLHGRTECTICAIVTGLSKHSNYPFDFLLSLNTGADMRFWGNHVLLELAPHVDVESFRKKLREHVIAEAGVGAPVRNMSITPLTALYYDNPSQLYGASSQMTGITAQTVQIRYIIIFAVAGSLVILCTLFNYLTLFVSRFRMRQREFALRILFGASGRSLFSLLSVEFALTIIVALLSGLFFIDILFPFFRKLSGIRTESASIYLESIAYIIATILISFLIFLLALVILRRKTLSAAFRRSNKNVFRKISVAVQLVISIGFAFASIVLVKQMYYLHNTDLGFTFANRASIENTFWEKVDMNVLHDKMKQIPEITESVSGFYPVIHSRIYSSSIGEWDGKPEGVQPAAIAVVHVSEQYLSLYEFKALQGEMLTDNDDPANVLINEEAAKVLGWNNPVGKTFGDITGQDNQGRRAVVKGVIKNVYNSSPTIAPRPTVYTLNNGLFFNYPPPCIVFKFKEGAWKTCKSKLENILAVDFPNRHIDIANTEEQYDSFLKSENTLLKILMFVALVCVIICIFGFVSLVSLTCEERRKEIAIRKINGATIKDILDIFFKEYLALLAVGAVIAFPTGYYIMRLWLEEYVLQTPISAWIYAVILLSLIMSIILCVGWKVYKTSTENPAFVVKS
jgi:ABC-type lipoprotein release transport system permease subunit